MRLASAPGVTADSITLGTTFSITGPGAGLRPLIETVQAYIQKTNEQGGVNGRNVRLVVLDDEYTPAYTVSRAQRLVEEEQVLAVVCPLGTGTNLAVADYYNQNQVPQLFVISGDPVWGNVERYPWSMGFQPAYADEARAFGRFTARNWPGTRVGILYQNDRFGKNYLHYRDSVGEAAAIVGEESYSTADYDVVRQVAALKAKGAELLLLAATTRYAGLALNAAAGQGWQPRVLIAGAANDPALFGLAGGAVNVEGAITAGWHCPSQANDPSLVPVRDLLGRYAPQIPLVDSSVWGFTLATVIVETLRRAGANLTRASLLAAAESFKNYQLAQLLPGISVSTSKTNHEPVRSVALARANKGRFVSFGTAISGA